MARINQTIMLRAQEMAATATEKIAADECLTRALMEFYNGDFEAVCRALAANGSSAFRNAIDRDQDLPDDGADSDDGHQMQLFDTRTYIVVDTPEHGPLIVPKEHQTLGHVRSWVRQQRSRHKVQFTRFDRFNTDIEAYAEDMDDSLLWLDIRPELQRAKTNALTGGDSDAA